MEFRSAYQWLKQNSLEWSYLDSAASLLAWDQRTHIPAGGHAHRVSQLALLARLMHQRSVDPLRANALAMVEASDLIRDPQSPEAVNIREWRRAFERAMRVPETLAAELAKQTAQAESVWETTRPTNDWKTFFPHLEQVFQLKQEQAQALGMGREPYDSLLDEFEPGVSAASMCLVFSKLKPILMDLLDRRREMPATGSQPSAGGTFPLEAQQAFLQRTLAAIGYDFGRGRLDTSAHPFTTGIGVGDVRITVRYHMDSFVSALLAAIHEAGHALYEQGLPEAHWGTPFGRPASVGIHESQSRLWENLIGRSPAFWQAILPSAREAFPAWSAPDAIEFVRMLNVVRPSLIRVEADEITYNLHILLRFELERSVVNGDLKVCDLPGAWNDQMKRLLGIQAPDFKDGVMQDVHWASGLIGYFPTYTFGNIYAAQLFQQAKKDVDGLALSISAGRFQPLLDWLREKIHSQGGRYLPQQLIQQVTGRPPAPDDLIAYLTDKYGAQ